MNKKITCGILQWCFIVTLIFAAYNLLAADTVEATHGLKFIPAGVFLVLLVLVNLAWGLISGQDLHILTEMDPITASFFLIACSIAVFGFLTKDTDKSKSALNWAFKVGLFVAGYESGKKRQKSKLEDGKLEGHQEKNENGI